MTTLHRAVLEASKHQPIGHFAEHPRRPPLQVAIAYSLTFTIPCSAFNPGKVVGKLANSIEDRLPAGATVTYQHTCTDVASVRVTGMSSFKFSIRALLQSGPGSEVEVENIITFPQVAAPAPGPDGGGGGDGDGGGDGGGGGGGGGGDSPGNSPGEGPGGGSGGSPGTIDTPLMVIDENAAAALLTQVGNDMTEEVGTVLDQVSREDGVTLVADVTPVDVTKICQVGCGGRGGGGGRAASPWQAAGGCWRRCTSAPGRRRALAGGDAPTDG
jgi:hypothetical protein